MTQTLNVPSTFTADHFQVEHHADAERDRKVEITASLDGLRVSGLLTGHEGAEALMKALAAQLGYTVLSAEQVQALTQEADAAVERASERQSAYLPTLNAAYLRINHGADDIRDLRSTLRELDIVTR